jgi:hypothetical protein
MGESGADLTHGSAVYSGDRAIRLSRAVPPDARDRGFRGRLSVIMQPRRLMGTPRTPPIGWPQRGLAWGGGTCGQVCWNRIPSRVAGAPGLLARSSDAFGSVTSRLTTTFGG